MIAQALAYSTFFAIPSVLLVAVGLFTLLAGPGTIATLMSHFEKVMPQQATQLLHSSLTRLDNHPKSGLVMTVVGFVLALWSTTGPLIERWIGNALGIQPVLRYLWWAVQWPILVGGLLAAFATLLYLGPDVDHPRWRFLTAGSAIAVVVWLAASGGFAVYTSMFGSYDKTWGSLAAVIVMLVWLWLTGLALLFGAEFNAEAERSRELRQGEPAERGLQVARG